MIGKDVKEDSIVYEHVEPLAPFLLPKILEEADRVDRKLRGDDLEKLDQEDREKPKDSSAWNIF